MPHMLARPHVLALPLLVAWAAGLIDAADRRAMPSFWLLPLMALWANLHGGFVFGLVLIAPLALDAVIGAEASKQKSLLLRWFGFGLCRARGKLRDALWLGRAACLAKNPFARRCAAADHGMAAGGFLLARSVRDSRC